MEKSQRGDLKEDLLPLRSIEHFGLKPAIRCVVHQGPLRGTVRYFAAAAPKSALTFEKQFNRRKIGSQIFYDPRVRMKRHEFSGFVSPMTAPRTG